MKHKYLWLKCSFFIEQEHMRDFYVKYIAPFNLEITKDIENVFCCYVSLSSIQGQHWNLSILHTDKSSEVIERRLENYFSGYFDRKALNATPQKKVCEAVDLWKPFDNDTMYINIFYLKLESKYPNIFNTFSSYKTLNKISKSIHHIINELEEINFTSLMEIVILSYTFLINTGRITLSILNDQIAFLEDRHSLYTEDIYVNLITMLHVDVQNNLEFLEECKNFSRGSQPFDLNWLNFFAEVIVELEVSCPEVNKARLIISEYALLFITSLGMSPLKEIYSLQLLRSYINQTDIHLTAEI